MAAGYWGKILVVDLSSESTQTMDLPVDVAKKFLGGRGLIAWYMCCLLYTSPSPRDRG